jgi:hypothetical protein
MSFRISRRIGPLRFSAYEHHGSRRYDDDIVFDTYVPNWPKRMVVITAAFAPAWVAFGLGHGLLFAGLAISGGIGLVVAYGRSEAANENGFRSFAAWCGTIAAGIALAVLIGMLAQSVIASAHAQERPAFPQYDMSSYCAKVSALLGDNPLFKEGCITNEGEAKKKISNLWDSAPADMEAQCMKLMGVGSPNNYQALSGCVAISVGNLWLSGKLKIVRAD